MMSFNPPLPLTATRQQDTYSIASIDIFPSGHYQDLRLGFPSCSLFSIHHFLCAFLGFISMRNKKMATLLTFLSSVPTLPLIPFAEQ